MLSLQVLSWVFRHSRSKLAERLVLLVIADAADGTGRNAWPSTAALAKAANLTDRGVQKAIVGLVTLGELAVEYNAGPRRANLYSVIMVDPELCSPSNPEQSSGSTPNSVHPQTPNRVRGEHRSPRTKVSLDPEQSSGKPTTEPKDIPPSLRSGGTRVRARGAAESKIKPEPRGSRLPADWRPGPSEVDWAHGQGYPDAFSREATDAFRDYWVGKAGADARKLDWAATWRNWLRRDWSTAYGTQRRNGTSGNPYLNDLRRQQQEPPALESS